MSYATIDTPFFGFSNVFSHIFYKIKYRQLTKTQECKNTRGSTSEQK